MLRSTVVAVFSLSFLLPAFAFRETRPNFVSVKNGRMWLNSRPYDFIGTNYWYGSLLPLEKNRSRGIDRLRSELDFLKTNGVTNLRLMAGAEGSGPINSVERVGPPLQPMQGEFDEKVARGLDVVLAEMAKRDMKAVIFFSNNWEWSGGFQQYLIWNKRLSPEWLTKKPDWDQLRDNVAKFYSCEPCVSGYRKQVEYIVRRRNKINGRRYIDDSTIMSWELANEPRPMRPIANDAYLKWINDSAALIRSLDRNHLITTGHEGWVGTVGIELFEQSHIDPNIDYVTIHIWPKNWGWITGGRLEEGFDNALRETEKYVDDNLAVVRRLRKPMVIEEFGLPRDGQLFAAGTPTTYRDRYYETLLSYVGGKDTSEIAGANFWAFGGTARPIKDRVFWKQGDEPMGDPPMEEQGLNSVFDSDRSTWSVITANARRLRR
jgi:mannan endo-1,4-beta-mannosidase